MNPENPFQPQQPYQPQPQPYAPQPPYGQPQPGQQGPAQNPVQPGVPMSSPLTPTPSHKRHNPAKKWVIMTFVFIFTTLSAGGGAAWALVNYFDQKNNVDSKVTQAVATAVKEQRDKDAAAFEQAEKEPNRLFAGPDDYGRLTFDYPKTWSVYEAKSTATSSGAYVAYFNPGVIPMEANDQRYALRVTIENKDYDKAVNEYSRLVANGELKSSSATIGGVNGVRLDGNFTKDIRGSAVIVKIRDKTATVRTDAGTFMDDFNAIIKTIEFNK